MNALTNVKTSGAMAAYIAGRKSFNDELVGRSDGRLRRRHLQGQGMEREVSRASKTLITRNDVHGDGSSDPAASLEVVIVRSSPIITKTWYEKGWEDGSNNPPDCFSSNGITPDANVPKKQNAICKTCKWDAFGSRAQEGFRGKACQDNRRIAIVPSKDIDNEAFDGPMLLRVPPASLKELVKHGDGAQPEGLAILRRGDEDRLHQRQLSPPYFRSGAGADGRRRDQDRRVARRRAGEPHPERCGRRRAGHRHPGGRPLR